MAQEIYGSGEIERGQLKTFSLAFDELTCDERPRIKSVVDKYGLESHYLIADRLCGLRNLSFRAPQSLDINDPEQPHTQEAMEALYKLAHDGGVRVMLCGEGAENHVLGSPLVFDSLIKNLKWCNLVRRLQSISSYRGRLSSLIKTGIVPLFLRSISEARYFDWLYAGLKQQYIPGWLTPAFRETIMDEIEAQESRLHVLPRFRTRGQQAEYEGFNPSNPILLSQISRAR